MANNVSLDEINEMKQRAKDALEMKYEEYKASNIFIEKMNSSFEEVKDVEK